MAGAEGTERKTGDPIHCILPAQPGLVPSEAAGEQNRRQHSTSLGAVPRSSKAEHSLAESRNGAEEKSPSALLDSLALTMLVLSLGPSQAGERRGAIPENTRDLDVSW